MDKKATICGIVSVFFGAIILFPSLSFSIIYKWVDKQGQIHITHYPPGADEIAEEPDKAAPETTPREIEPIAPAGALQTQSAEEKREASVPIQPAQSPQLGPQAAKKPPPSATTKSEPSAVPQGVPSFPAPKAPGMPPGALVGAISFISSFFLVIAIAAYLFFSACLYSIAKKLNVPSPFLAWIPLVQVWVFVVAAKGTDESPVLWIIGMILPVIGFVVHAYLWICITENMEKNKWLGLLSIVPVANLVFMAWLAMQKGPSRLSEEQRFMEFVQDKKAPG